MADATLTPSVKTVPKPRDQHLRDMADCIRFLSMDSVQQGTTMLSCPRKQPDFSEFFLTYLLTRTVRVEEDLIDQLFNSSEKRLARLLLLLANLEKTRSRRRLMPRSIGDPGGDDRYNPFACQFFHEQFRRLGLISYNGTVEVHRSLLERGPTRQTGDRKGENGS